MMRESSLAWHPAQSIVVWAAPLTEDSQSYQNDKIDSAVRQSKYSTKTLMLLLEKESTL